MLTLASYPVHIVRLKLPNTLANYVSDQRDIRCAVVFGVVELTPSSKRLPSTAAIAQRQNIDECLAELCFRMLWVKTSFCCVKNERCCYS